MSYALFLDGHIVAGPFPTKSKCWDEATKRGLITMIPSFDEDPPRRRLDLRCAIHGVPHSIGHSAAELEQHSAVTA